MGGTWKQAISKALSSLLFLKLSMPHQNSTILQKYSFQNLAPALMTSVHLFQHLLQFNEEKNPNVLLI